MASFSSRLTVFALKLLKVKKAFAKDPVNFRQLRKMDLRRTPRRLKRKFQHREFEVLGSNIVELAPKEGADSGILLLYFPGGAFVSGPGQHHWTSVAEFVGKTRAKAWLIDYPKAPESQAEALLRNVDAIYAEALKSVAAPNHLVLMGDSAGGNLVMGLVQGLVSETPSDLPGLLVGISPVFDSRLENPAIPAIDPQDPMLSQAGLLSAKRLYAGDISLADPRISPLLGSFEGFPTTLLFLGGRDILYPDGKLAAEKMRAANVSLTLHEDPEMMHIWPLLPVLAEGKQARKAIVEAILGLTG